MKTVNLSEGSIVKDNMVPVCLNKTSDNSKIIINGCDYNLKKYPKNEYTPIGIVVMNPLHTDARYEKKSLNRGKYLIMSLKLMDCDDTVNGTVVDKGMAWGVDNFRIAKLHNYTKAVTIRNKKNEEDNVEYESCGVVPTSYDDEYGECIAAPYLGYSDLPFSPSPYRIKVKNNEFIWDVNPLYTEGGKKKHNALSDFEGKRNTEIILSNVKEELKNALMIPNSYEEGNFPAATCCSRFRTEGTESGDWWLPSCGELGYCATFFYENRETFKHINEVYGKRICTENLNGWHWSSTQWNGSSARYVFLNNGSVGNYFTQKYNPYHVRAVTAVEADSVMTEHFA